METEASRTVNFIASMPGLGHSTVTEEVLRQILLDTGGQVMAQGGLWDIHSQHLGAGVFSIKLRRWKYDREVH